MVPDSFKVGACEDGPLRGVCPKDQNLVHQYAKCLSSSHGTSECSENGARQRPGKGEEGGLGPPILTVTIARAWQPLAAYGRRLQDGSQTRK